MATICRQLGLHQGWRMLVDEGWSTSAVLTSAACCSRFESLPSMSCQSSLSSVIIPAVVD